MIDHPHRDDVPPLMLSQDFERACDADPPADDWFLASVMFEDPVMACLVGHLRDQDNRRL